MAPGMTRESWLDRLRWWFGPYDLNVQAPSALPDRSASAMDATLPVMDIACAADAHYVPHCATMLHSLFCHSADYRIRVHFLYPACLPSDMFSQFQDFINQCGGEFLPTEVPDAEVEDLFATAEISRVAWYRSLLPQLRPSLDRVLYLDCDTLIIDSLVDLWNVELGNNLIAAVPNVVDSRIATRHHALGVPADQTYINSGVLLMNLRAMREEKCTEQILAHAREHGTRLIWVDQDSINKVLGVRCRKLSARWNCQNSLFYWRSAKDVFGEDELQAAISNPAVIHFEGPGIAKPWHPLCRHPYTRHYRHHRSETPWPLEIPGASWRHRLMLLLPLRITPPLLYKIHRLLRIVRARRR